jgi:hypothetical protein
MTTRQQKAIEGINVDVSPANRVQECRRSEKLVIRGPCSRIGTKDTSYPDEARDAGHESPWIKPAARHHKDVTLSRCGGGSGETNPVAVVGENLPTHCHFGGVEIALGNWDQDNSHNVILQA